MLRKLQPGSAALLLSGATNLCPPLGFSLATWQMSSLASAWRPLLFPSPPSHHPPLGAGGESGHRGSLNEFHWVTGALTSGAFPGLMPCQGPSVHRPVPSPCRSQGQGRQEGCPEPHHKAQPFEEGRCQLLSDVPTVSAMTGCSPPLGLRRWKAHGYRQQVRQARSGPVQPSPASPR